MNYALEVSNSESQHGRTSKLGITLSDTSSSSVITYYLAVKLDPWMGLI